jgi:hypothetical protein
MRLVKASGWRWWSQKHRIFISFGTDMYWFHLELWRFSIAIERGEESSLRKYEPKE